MNASNFFSKEQKEDIKLAIRNAEFDTSGEIRVHVELNCEDSVQRALYVFKKLKMDQTEHRNGVLIYLAVDSRTFTIVGDEGINTIVPDNFWEDVKTNMLIHFRESDFTKGIISSIHMVGDKLKVHFPHQSSDENELSDEISFDDDELKDEIGKSTKPDKVIDEKKMNNAKLFYFLDGKDQKGPYNVMQLKDIGIMQETLIWSDEMGNWIQAKNVIELSNIFKDNNISSVLDKQNDNKNIQKVVNKEIKKLKSKIVQEIVSSIILLIIILAIVGSTLSCHFVFYNYKLHILMKDNLTFKNTFITDDDIEDIIKRYNEATIFEKITIKQDPLIKKLIEEGIINDNNDSDQKEVKETSYNINQGNTVSCTQKEINNNNGLEPTIIKTCLYKNIKTLSIGNPDYKGCYSYQYELYKMQNGNYIRVNNSIIFNKKQNKLIEIINNKIYKDFQEFSADPESKNCFEDVKFSHFTIDQLGIEFEKNRILFNADFGLCSACMAVGGTVVIFSLDEIEPFLDV